MNNCPLCDSDDIKVINEYNYHGHIINDAGVIQCNNCGEELIPTSTSEMMDSFAYEILGILSPNDIREKRESFGKTQAEIANMLGVTRATINRWENGHVYQSNDHDIRLKKIFSDMASENESVNKVRSYLYRIINDTGSSHKLARLAAHGNRIISASEYDQIKENLPSINE